MAGKMLSVKEVMALLGKSSLTIRNWCNGGKLVGAVKSPGGKEWMIPESALQGFTGASLSPIEEPRATSQQSESTEVKKAKEAADIATSKDKQVEAEIQTKLRGQGYQSMEEGQADIAKMKEDANLIF